MPWDATAAVNYSKGHASPHSLGKCAQYTREAVEAGGVKLQHHISAKDYGSSLTKVGFALVPSGANTIYRAGDVGIVQPIKGHPHGHMAMFDGKHWISDFVQLHGLYPGSSYRAVKPAFAVYRHPQAAMPVQK